ELDLVVGKIDAGNGDDLAGLNRLAVLFDLRLDLLLVDLAVIIDLDAFGAKRHRNTRFGLLCNNRPENLESRVFRCLSAQWNRHTQTKDDSPKESITHGGILA